MAKARRKARRKASKKAVRVVCQCPVSVPFRRAARPGKARR